MFFYWYLLAYVQGMQHVYQVYQYLLQAPPNLISNRCCLKLLINLSEKLLVIPGLPPASLQLFLSADTLLMDSQTLMWLVEEEPDTKRAATGQGATPAAAIAGPTAPAYLGQPPQAAAYPQYAAPG